MDKTSLAGRVTRGVLQGVLPGEYYQMLTRGVLPNDLLRTVGLSTRTLPSQRGTKDFLQCVWEFRQTDVPIHSEEHMIYSAEVLSATHFSSLFGFYYY